MDILEPRPGKSERRDEGRRQLRAVEAEGQRQVAVLNAPASFEAEPRKPTRVAVGASSCLASRLSSSRRSPRVGPRIQALAAPLASVPDGDAILWFACPKGSSKRYTCDFNRDTGWDALGSIGFEAVSEVAIDEDWSALRFRRTEYIKSLQRSPQRALSALGQARVAKRAHGRRSRG